jgi:predicted aspartyl protease
MRGKSVATGLVSIAALAWLSIASQAGVLEVPLIKELDQFGSQIETIQGYQVGAELLTAYSIYDTGASVVSLSLNDRLSFDLAGFTIPIKVPSGATADGIGGALTGDVSHPGTVVADGLHAVTISVVGGLPSEDINLDGGVSVPGVQMFVGASARSESLPTITGTPIHYPTAAHPGGTAARINMQGYTVDLGELFPDFGTLFDGIVFTMPDISFVPSGAKLSATGETTEVVRLPVALAGEGNYSNPGDQVTVAPNPVQTGVTLQNQPASQLLTVGGKTFLFDTGAQLSIISTDIATGLGLDLDHPETTMDVQGAAGTVLEVPGYTIDALELPRDDNGDGATDGTLRFTEVPVYVLDLMEGLDGILGMNLFNTASEMLYDPYDPQGPSVQLTFLANPLRDIPDSTELSALQLLTAAFPALSGPLGMGANLPDFRIDFNQAADAPEPASLLLLAAGVVAILGLRRRIGGGSAS